ncbi:MAG: fused MFS/spermidine synthase [Desulfovibrionaceae bacterium]|nr:fused MFS/spermidine synthase [Desulfovibrionaceae bacterium]
MLEAVAFLCGAAVMALEMTGSRLLSPYLGSSVLVWTALIGVIMAFLSCGYWLGGKAADRGPSSLRLAALILAAAFCVLIIGLFHQGLLSWVSGMSMYPEYAAMLAAAMLFGPASLLLGMVSPYAVRVALETRQTAVEKSGAIIGRFSAAGAIGSILGTFAGGYYLIAWVGSRQSLYFISTSLLFVALAALFSDKVRLRRQKLPLLIICGLGLGLVLNLQAGYSRHMLEKNERAAGDFRLDTRYSHLHIWESNHADRLRMRVLSTPPQLTQAAMDLDDPQRLCLEYTKHFSLAWQLRPEAEKFLLLGGAAYSIPKYLLGTRDRLALDVVEIDPAMTALARELFALREDSRLRVHHEDARTYLNRYASSKAADYDIIMADAFSSTYNIPFQLCTVEFAGRVHDSLAPGGIYIANVLSAVTGEKSLLLRSFRASFERVFPSVHVFPLRPGAPSTVQNIMLLAMKEELPTQEVLENAGLNRRISSSHPQQAVEEFALAYKMLRNEWRIILEEDLPPLYDNFAPVERYSLPLMRE